MPRRYELREWNRVCVCLCGTVMRETESSMFYGIFTFLCFNVRVPAFLFFFSSSSFLPFLLFSSSLNRVPLLIHRFLVFISLQYDVPKASLRYVEKAFLCFRCGKLIRCKYEHFFFFLDFVVVVAVILNMAPFVFYV